MYGEDRTAEELVENPWLGIKWNGRNYDLEIQEDSMRLIPLNDHENEDNEEVTLSFEEVTEKLQNEDIPFNTARS